VHLNFNIYVWALLLLVATGCSSTRYSGSEKCYYPLQPGDKILIPSLPANGYDYYLKTIRKKFEKTGVTIIYLPEEEWNFRANGVSSQLDSSSYPILKRLGYTHFLFVEPVNQKPSQSFINVNTPQEQVIQSNRLTYKPVWYDMSTQAVINMDLYSIGDSKDIFRSQIKTTIGALESHDRNGNEYNVNLSSTSSALSTAIRKGTKRIANKCTR
jgi:hypothetical protein